jgi:hypothetical protein
MDNVVTFGAGERIRTSDLGLMSPIGSETNFLQDL